MAANGIIGPGIFEDLQKKIDEDTKVKEVSRVPSHRCRTSGTASATDTKCRYFAK